MKIKDLPRVELPREKLEKYGANKLADYELLAILLGSGIAGLNVLQLSKKILKEVRNIGIDKISFDDLIKIKGLGKAKAAQVLAVIGLSKRLNSEQPEILSPQDVWKLCVDFRESKKEHFAVFYLDTQSKLIERQIISIGTLSASLVHPREVFEPAVRLSTSSIIVVHNHPSGSLVPSQADMLLTKNLKKAGEILGINLENHIIVTKDKFGQV